MKDIDVSLSKFTQNDQGAWVLTSKRPGDKVASWVIDYMDKSSVRYLKRSERCSLTSFCYPRGVKLIRAKVHKAF